MRDRKGKSARIVEKIKKRIGIDVSEKINENQVSKEAVKKEEPKKEALKEELKKEKK